MENFNKYLTITDAALASDFVETLTNEEKIALRKELEDKKIPVVRSLYYDYANQKWI